MSESVHDDLLVQRPDFPILASKTYLVNNSLGAVHQRSRDRLVEFYDLWAAQGVVAWETWAPEMYRVADLVGEIIGAEPGTTVMRQDVSSLLASLASCIDWSGRRNRVVYSDLEWPGSRYMWSEQRRAGADLVVVPNEGDGVHLDVQRIVDAIDDRTAVVPISLVLFRSSTLVDVRPVIERAHEVGAWVVLDAYQAAGCLPVRAAELEADVVVGGSVKYLCGGPEPPGCPYALASPRRRSNRPTSDGSGMPGPSTSPSTPSAMRRVPGGSRAGRRPCPRSTPPRRATRPCLQRGSSGSASGRSR